MEPTTGVAAVIRGKIAEDTDRKVVGKFTEMASDKIANEVEEEVNEDVDVNQMTDEKSMVCMIS